MERALEDLLRRPHLDDLAGYMTAIRV